VPTGVLDLTAELAKVTIKEPRSGNDTPVTPELLLRHLRDPSAFELIRSRVWGAISDYPWDSEEHGEAVKREWFRIIEDIDSLRVEREEKELVGHSPNTTARKILRRVVDYYRPSLFRVGTVELGQYVTDEPQVLEIQDDYDIRRVGSLRSDTDAVMKGKRPRTEIRVELDLPDIHAINQTLRDLVAQCRIAPIIPVESDLLVDVLLNKFAGADRLETLYAAYVQTKPDELVLDRFESFDQLREELVQGDDVEFLRVLQARVDNDKQQQTRTSPVREGLPDREDVPFYGIRFAMSLVDMTVVTIPQSNHAAKVTLTFRKVNDRAFNISGLAFRDNSGNKTFDLRNCGYFRKYLDLVFFNDDPPEPEWILTPGDTHPNPSVMKEIETEETQFQCPVEFHWLSFHTSNLKSWSLHNEPIVLKDVRVNWQNKIAYLPLVGQQDPVPQHLGTSNMLARMHFATTDKDVVQRFHSMKEELDEMRRNPDGIDRHERLYVRNGLLNALGGYSFAIGNVTTQTDPKTKDLRYITVTLVESKYTAHERETPYLKREIIARDHIRDFFLNALVPAFETGLEKIRTAGAKGTVLVLNKQEEIAFGLMTGYRILAQIEEALSDHDQIEYSFVDAPHGVIQGRLLNAAVTRHYSEERYFADTQDRKLLYNSYLSAPWIAGEFPNDPRVAVSGSPAFYSPFGAVKNLFTFFGGGAQDLGPAVSNEIKTKAQIAREQRLDDIDLGSPYGTFDAVGIASANANKVPHYLRAGEPSGTQVNRILRMAEGMNEVSPDRWHATGRRWPPGSKEFLEYFKSQENAVIKPGKDPAASWFFKILMGPGSPKVRNTFWEDIIDTILDRPADAHPSSYAWISDDLDRSYILLRATIQQGLDERFVGFDSGKYRQDTRHVSTDASDPEATFRSEHNYPDLQLPTYEQLFSDGTKDKSGRYNLIQYEDNQVDRGGRWNDRALWRVFAPRYSDLGIEPPFNVRVGLKSQWEAQQQIARKVNDVVEPSFFYYPHSIKDTQGDFLDYEANYENHLDDQERDTEKVIHLAWANAEEWVDIGGLELIQEGKLIADAQTINSKIHERVDGLFREAREFPLGRVDYPEGFRNPKRAVGAIKDFNEGKVKRILFVDSNGKWILAKEHLGKSGPKTYKFKYNPIIGEKRTIRNAWSTEAWEYDIGTTPGIMQHATGRMVDNHMSMSRAYPTFRLYFIEEDRTQFIYSDDFYGVNCVSSIECRQSKSDAALLVIRLTNVSRNFEEDRFISPDDMDKLGIPPDDEDGEPLFRFFRFRTGTLVQLRMGYSSNPEELPITFTGKIVEVQTGQVITLTCQGHRAELLNEIEYARSSKNFHQILDECFRKINPPHLGRSLKLGEYSQEFASTTLGEKSVMDIPWWSSFLKTEVNSYTRNVYIQSSAPKEYGFWEELAKGNVANAGSDLGEGFSRVWGIRHAIGLVNWFTPDSQWDNWIIPLQPFYNAIQEMARHQPGTVAYVVPFEQDATLFFGLPSQPYLAYQPSLAESRTYEQLHRLVKQKDIREGPGKILADFLASSRYATSEGKRTAITSVSLFRQYLGENVVGIDKASSFLEAFASLLEENGGGVPANPWNDPFFDNSENQLRWGSFRNDWTGDWEYLRDNDKELLRFAFAYIMEWNPLIVPWPGGIEGRWNTIGRLLMGPLLDKDLDTSETAEDFETAFSDLFGDETLNASADISADARFNEDIWSLDKIEHSPVLIAELLSKVHSQGHVSAETFERLIEEFLGETDLPIDGFELQIHVAPEPTVQGKSSRVISGGEKRRLISIHEERAGAQMQALKNAMDQALQNGRLTQDQVESVISRAETKNSDRLQEINNVSMVAFIPTKGVRGVRGSDFSNVRTDRGNRQLKKYLSGGRTRYVMMRLDRIRERISEISRGHAGVSEGELKRRSGFLRLFIHFLRVWHEEQHPGTRAKRESRDARSQKLMKTTRAFSMEPGHRVFRDYHLVTSRADIIDNQITATLREMHNTVTIRRPRGTIKYQIGGEETFTPPDPSATPLAEKPILFSHAQNWESFPQNEGIPLHPKIGREYRKLLVKVENNAVDQTQAARCLLSNLAEAVRPMYRGHLTIVGRNMKPHDVINLHDEWNDMIGPIEVDEVVHHFTPQTGWVTTVTPCTLAVANDQPSRVQLSGWQWWLNRSLEFYSEYWLAIEIGMFLITAGVGNVALGAARGAAQATAASLGRSMLRHASQKAATAAAKATGKKAAKKAAKATLERTVGRVILGMGGGSMKLGRKRAANHATAFFGKTARVMLTNAGTKGVFLTASRLTYLSSPLLLSSTWLQMNNGLRQVPVDIAVLMQRGRPYTAGLEFSMDDFLSFSDRWTGFWNEMLGVAEVAAFKPDFAILDDGES